MPKPGPTPIQGKPMSASERNRRTRRRKQIFRQTAKSYEMTPVTIYLPNDFIRMLRRLDHEDATTTSNVDTIGFAAFYEFVNRQSDTIKAEIGFDPEKHAFNPFELALTEAVDQIDQEGL